MYRRAAIRVLNKMFISKKEHILTNVIMGGAVCNLLFESAEAAQRLFLKKSSLFQPFMLEQTMWRVQMTLSLVKLIILLLLFYRAVRRLSRIRKVTERDDIAEMAKLQYEAIPESISTLSAYSIEQLIQIWASIFIGAEMVYDITAVVYRDFIGSLSAMFNTTDVASATVFVDFYNNTHGFKYMGMFVALILGVFVTGVFLKDRLLKVAAFVVAMLFTLAFFIVKMDTITVFRHSIGIVWTSVIFHMTQTVGLVALALYMGKKYRGL